MQSFAPAEGYPGQLVAEWLEHVRLLLYNLSQLLELWVVAQEVKAVGIERTSTCTSTCSAPGACTASTSTTLASLSGGLEQVYRLVSPRAGGGSTCVRASSGRRSWCASLCLLCLFLKSALWNTLEFGQNMSNMVKEPLVLRSKGTQPHGRG